MRCAPPRGNGQPPVCAHTPSTSPTAALSGDLERQRGMRGHSGKQGARAMARESAIRPAPRRANRRHAEPRQQQRMARHAERGQHVVAQARPGVGERLEQRPPGFAVAVPDWPRSRSIERSSRTAVPSSSGCASGASGWTHSRPCAASGNCSKHGEHTARGCTAEQISWTNPGSVNSADRAPPPIVAAPS